MTQTKTAQSMQKLVNNFPKKGEGGGTIANVDENIDPDSYCEQSQVIDNDKVDAVKVGDKVEYKIGDEWYEAILEKIFDDGSVKVTYGSLGQYSLCYRTQIRPISS